MLARRAGACTLTSPKLRDTRCQRGGDQAVLDDAAERAGADFIGIEVDAPRALRIPDRHVRVGAVPNCLDRRPGTEAARKRDGTRRERADAAVIVDVQGSEEASAAGCRDATRQLPGLDSDQRSAKPGQGGSGGEAGDTATDDHHVRAQLHSGGSAMRSLQRRHARRLAHELAPQRGQQVHPGQRQIPPSDSRGSLTINRPADHRWPQWSEPGRAVAVLGVALQHRRITDGSVAARQAPARLEARAAHRAGRD
jgi:hypothetical protein